MRLTSLLQRYVSNLRYVPPYKPVNQLEVNLLQAFIDSSDSLVVITGAGLSTESGIPDYRSENVGLYARSERRPIQYKEFISSAPGRQRYWARNYVGWPSFASYQPNVCHKILAEYEQKGNGLHWLVTQNVDALHTKAGSKQVTELHGCTHRVMCMDCPNMMDRWDLQPVFAELNPEFQAESLELAPDGDVVLPDEVVKEFKVPPCPSCGGILKPDVTFFGDNVKRSVVDFVYSKIKESDSLLVLGSSLYVYSSYRLIRRAHELNKPIAVINIGETRGDKFANLKISARCGEILPLLKIL